MNTKGKGEESGVSRLFKKIKWLPTALGIMMILVGLLALISPQDVENVLPMCIGIVCLGLGMCELLSSFADDGQMPEYIPGMHRIRSIVNIAMGMVFLFNGTVSVMFIAVALGVWAVTFGVLRFHDAYCRRKEGRAWGICAADAVVKCVVGVCALAGPLIGPGMWLLTVGVYFIFVGASVVISSLYLDSTHNCKSND